MPSSWSSLTPLLSIKRAFSSQREKKKKRDKETADLPVPTASRVTPALLPPTVSPSTPLSPSTGPRFSRRYEQLRTRKYLNQPTVTPSAPRTPIIPPRPSLQTPPTVPPRLSPISSRLAQPPPTVPPRRSSVTAIEQRRPTLRATQKWPSASTLLEWMEPSLRQERDQSGPDGYRGARMRHASEGQRPSVSGFYSSESILLPTRREDRRGRDSSREGSTTERVAAWIRGRKEERGEWRTRSERWKRRAASISSLNRSIDNLHRSIDSLNYSMPASSACSNCWTKYSLLNREEGCAGCPLSFCKKCVQWRITMKGDKPEPVCRNCFERIRAEREREEKSATSRMYPSVPSSSSSSSQPRSYFHSGPNYSNPTPQPTVPQQPAPIQYSTPPVSSAGYSTPSGGYSTPQPHSSSSSLYPSHLSQPWWTEADLPPPSMRGEYGKGVVQPRPLVKGMPTPTARSTVPSSSSSSSHPSAIPPPRNEMEEMEERAKRLRDEEDRAPPPSLSSLEERLAALRGVEVELVRNPRVLFERREEREEETVERLMEEARSRAVLEEKNDPDRLLEERAARLIEKKEEKREEEEREGEGEEEGEGGEEARLSTVPSDASRMSEYSEATKEELADIDRVMREAAARVEENERAERREREEGKDVEMEMREGKKLAAQLSLDVEKVNQEMAAFWEKENGKRGGKARKDSSSSEEMDDATLAEIVREAEMAPDEPIAEKQTVGQTESESPSKKKGIFGRMFKK